ncbi:MAG TPA: class I SAM-dependent methyltransferase [Cyclobacteriaceae bacterium]|nr:class I SAM-dependent methyltransferase [Cyclobacteriaceae bacterium]
MNEDQLKALARQLRQPQDHQGLEVADMMNQSNHTMIEHSIDLLDLDDQHRVLELGPARASHLEYLMGKAKRLQYQGLEISPLMVKEAERINLKRVHDGEASFLVYDGERVPFSNGHFDRIFTVNTIYFWDEPEKLARELYRVLQPGGRFNITFAQKAFMERLPFTQYGFHLYDTDKVQKLLSGVGFSFHQAVDQQETVTSKTGDKVQRQFTTLTAIKSQER